MCGGVIIEMHWMDLACPILRSEVRARRRPSCRWASRTSWPPWPSAPGVPRRRREQVRLPNRGWNNQLINVIFIREGKINTLPNQLCETKHFWQKRAFKLSGVPQVCGGRLPEQLRVLREVKPVVDELERDPKVLPEGEGRVDEKIVFRGKRTDRIFDKFQPCAGFPQIILQIMIYINHVQGDTSGCSQTLYSGPM